MSVLLVLLATCVYLVVFVFAMRREMRAFYERERMAQRRRADTRWPPLAPKPPPSSRLFARIVGY